MTSRRAKPLVLIADDNEDNRDIYSTYLSTMLAVETVVAADGEEVLRLATARTPSVVVLDLGMPGLDGWEVARRLKRDPKTRQALLIALTGYTTANDKQRAMDAGCDQFLTKPYLPSDLAEIVRAHLGLASTT